MKDHKENENVAGCNTPTMVSLQHFLNEAEVETDHKKLETFYIGTDASYFAMFTDKVIEVEAHYLKAAKDWLNTYARCLGEGCPACKAGVTAKKYLLLPVVDRIDNRVKIMRISNSKGPGQLLTELGAAFEMPDRSNLTFSVSRENYVTKLEIFSDTDLDPEVARAVKEFEQHVSSGDVEISSVIPSYSADELITHDRIKKILDLKGGA